jgi:hypothetical protein
MGLALGGSCADGGPTNEVCQILRHHGIQKSWWRPGDPGGSPPGGVAVRFAGRY